MKSYPPSVEAQITRFYRSLNERDRRRYAAVEAIRWGHGGQESISQLCGSPPPRTRCDNQAPLPRPIGGFRLSSP